MTEQELIKKGFNHGYELQQKDREWAQAIEASISRTDHPYVDGFKSGRKEKMIEQGLWVEERDKSMERSNGLFLE